jgi:hypothetical protein
MIRREMTDWTAIATFVHGARGMTRAEMMAYGLESLVEFVGR